jgi:hypothetical protein
MPKIRSYTWNEHILRKTHITIYSIAIRNLDSPTADLNIAIIILKPSHKEKLRPVCTCQFYQIIYWKNNANLTKNFRKWGKNIFSMHYVKLVCDLYPIFSPTSSLNTLNLSITCPDFWWMIALCLHVYFPSPGILFSGGTGVWTQGFVLARQANYCLSHSSCSLFNSGCFEDRILLFVPSWPGPWSSNFSLLNN